MTLLKLLCTTVALFTLPPCSGAQGNSRAEQGGQLKFVLILSRHGVRSPTKPNDQLDPYSAQPWPAWEVEPGELTPRGAELLRLFGAYDRAWLQQAKLLPAIGCPPDNAAFFWADTDHRTLGSAAALAESILPGCPVQVHSLAAEVQDALFHPLAAEVAPPSSQAAVSALSARLHGDAGESVTANRPALDLLMHVLAPNGQPAPRKQLFAVPPSLAPGSGDHMVSLLGPLATASTLSENLLLEYADNKPIADVGWDRADEGTLRSLLSLHSAYFDLLHRTPLLAQAEASNLLEHVLDTLQQAVTGKAVMGAIGPVGEQLVVLLGHDTNLAALAALLNVHWTLDSRRDDTPPGAQLAFELWHNPRTGADDVRIEYRMQTLGQLRQAQALSPAQPPASERLAVPGCAPCTANDFTTLGRKALDPRYTTFFPAAR